MKAKQKENLLISTTRKPYDEYIRALKTINILIQDYIEPEVFKISMAYVDKEKLYQSQITLEDEVKNADTAYKEFSKIYKKLDNIDKLSDSDVTYECRLRDIVPVFNSLKKDILWSVKQHVEMMKQIESVKLNQKPNIYQMSFISTFERMLEGDIELREEQLDTLLPMIQRGLSLDEKTYKRIEKLYFSNLELSIVNKMQMDFWNEQKLTRQQQADLKRLSDMVLYVYQMNIDILMAVRIMRSNLITRASVTKLYSSKLNDLLVELSEYDLVI